MADNETIADIIAEKRRRADEIERDCAEKMKRGELVSDCYARELVADIRREADRLEAAHRRELSKNVSKNGADFGQLGNAAAMREALDEIIDKIDNWRTGDTMEHWQYSQLFDIADAALAAPARNCDTLQSAKTLLDEYIKQRGFCSENQIGRIFELALPVIDWLLSLATEQKGDGDGSK